MRPVLTRGIYAITDCRDQDEDALLYKTGRILAAGAVVLQYRDKSVDKPLRLDRARALQALCREHNVRYLINDDIQLASDIGADGVHIGKHDAHYNEARSVLGEDAIIGISCYNSFTNAITAQQAGADYIAFGSFFPTTTKNSTVQADTELLSRARIELTIPVVAIGGITPENGKPLVQAGVDMLAVVSSIYAPADPLQTMQEFNTLFRE